jgi:hypothetical protein
LPPALDFAAASSHYPAGTNLKEQVMKNRLHAAWTAGALALFLFASVSGPAMAASDTGKEPSQSTEPQKPSEPPPAPKKAEPEGKKDDKSVTSGAKQAGHEVSSAFKKFGHDVGDFFDGLFH